MRNWGRGEGPRQEEDVPFSISTPTRPPLTGKKITKKRKGQVKGKPGRKKLGRKEDRKEGTFRTARRKFRFSPLLTG